MPKGAKETMQISSAGRPWKNEAHGQGFSLIELIIVLVIIGLVLLLASPVFTKGINSIRLKTAVRELSSTLRHARSLAVSIGKEQAVHIDVETGRYWITDRVSEPHELPQGIRFLNVTSGGKEFTSGKSEITFYPVGNSNGGSINLGDEQNEYTIEAKLITGVVEVHSEKR